MKRPNAGDLLTESQAMALAIGEAHRGRGYVAPNPPVGCVIVDSKGRFLSSGYHKKCGGPHAEIEALNQISDKEKLKAAKVFVTLEPCSHHGRTPPCADTLARLPLSKVIYGHQDPNPQVSGQGVHVIKKAGIQVELWQRDLEHELAELIEVFTCNMTKKRAFVALKAAITLDGQLAEKSGKSQWITGKESRTEVHRLRGQFDGILVGRGTVETDNPLLNVRSPDYSGKTNKVVLLDPNNLLEERLPRLQIWNCHDPKDIFQFIGAENKNSKCPPWNQIALPLDGRGGGFDLSQISTQLYNLGVYSVLVEGGADTYGRYLTRRAADRIYLFIAPKVLGQSCGINWAGNFSGASLGECPRVLSCRVKVLGEDVLITGRLK